MSEAGERGRGCGGNQEIILKINGGKMMLFGPGILLAGGATIVIACIDKTLEGFGFHFLGKVLRIAIPLAAMAAGVYFLETNAILGWLR